MRRLCSLRRLTRKFRMCPRESPAKKKGWEADAPRDVTAWRSGVTALWCFCLLVFLFFFAKDDDLDYVWLREPPLPPRPPAPSSVSSCCSSSSKRSSWLMVLRARCVYVYTVAQYVDIPLSYRLHCRAKTCEHFAICCWSNGASRYSFTQLFALSLGSQSSSHVHSVTDSVAANAAIVLCCNLSCFTSCYKLRNVCHFRLK